MNSQDLKQEIGLRLYYAISSKITDEEVSRMIESIFALFQDQRQQIKIDFKNWFKNSEEPIEDFIERYFKDN